MRKGEKNEVKDLKEQAEKLTKGQKATLKQHRAAWWMRVWMWWLAKKLVWMMRRERLRAWVLVPGIPGEARKRMTRLVRKGQPIPVFRDLLAVADI